MKMTRALPHYFQRVLLALAACICMLLITGQAHAARVTNSVTVNGAGSVQVLPGDTITVVVNATTDGTGTGRWRATGWRISTTAPGTVTCVDNTNHDAAGTFSETFTVTAPAAEGTYNLYIVTYSDSGCTANAVTTTLSNAVVAAIPPTVSSIVRANSNPTGTGTAPSWTVTFSEAVTGVDALDFALVASYGVSGAVITSVTGSGTTWTVTANTGNGNGGGDLGLNLVNNSTIIDSGGRALSGNGTGEVYMVSPPCTQPTNTPSGVTLTCVCDNFNRASLNPSPIYGSNWITSISSASDTTGILPYIANQGYLRLTNNTTYNGKAATAPGAFPAAGNYISVEYRLFAYNGSNADGVAVTLSDYTVPPVPGSSGGSLGYAQKTGINGFAGGWIGVGIDEFGNYQNATEGRIGGPGARAQSVAVRGSGSGTTGYAWLGGTAANLSPTLSNGASTTPAPGHPYQVIVDARSVPTSATVAVNRNTGSGYTSLVNLPNVYTAATAQGTTQAAVPANWQISFTGSTGASTNIHEIGSVRICAQTIVPPGGGTATGFNAIDEAVGTPPGSPAVQDFLRGDIFMKLVGAPFKLNVAALSNNQIQTGYVLSGTKDVTVKLVDNSDGVCVIDNSQPNYCSTTCKNKTAVTGGSQTMTFTSSDAGKKLSANFTLNTAYKNLVAIISDSATSACSTDAFSVRPLSFSPVVITATNPPKTVFKAGTDQFTITATTNGVAGSPSGYTGVPKVNNAVVAGTSVAGAVVGVFPAATPGTSSSTSAGTGFIYTEVGSFTLPGYPVTNAASPRGVYEGFHATECSGSPSCVPDTQKAITWTGVDSISTKGDCVDESYSNSKDANGKYGCLFGTTNSTSFGRFTPDHFTLSRDAKDSSGNDIKIIANRSELACNPASSFTYMGEPLRAVFTLIAKNGTGGTTKNYNGALASLNLNVPGNFNLGALDSSSSSTPTSITAITKANPGVVTTSTAHGYANGDKVAITNVMGMTEVNNRTYKITVIDATHFSLQNMDTTNFSTAGASYGTYVSGGTAWKQAVTGVDLTSRVTVTGSSGSWPTADDAGTGALMGVAKDVSLVFTLNRKVDNALIPPQVVPDGPLMPEFGIALVDADGVPIVYDMDITAPAGTNDHASIGLSQLLFGRMKLTNALGSDRLDLPIPMRAEYWNSASGMFVPNIFDSCTPISCANLTLLNYKGGVTAANMPTGNILVGNNCAVPITLNAGAGTLRLRRPTAAIAAKGSVEVCIDLGTDASNVCVTSPVNPVGQAWLQGRWRAASLYNDDPWCRATFGVYKNANEFIYFREMY